MGLLKLGRPLSWRDSRPKRKLVRDHGIKQFVRTFQRLTSSTDASLLYGDEVEYGIFKVDHAARRVQLSLRAAEVKEFLNSQEAGTEHCTEGAHWHPEYGSWMVESTPGRPYSGYMQDLLRIERNMRLRRCRIMAALAEDEIVPTTTCFPLLGTPGTWDVAAHGDVRGPVANSEYLPDAVINPHPRFAALTKNIRERRGSNVDIRMPLYQDTHTPEFSEEGLAAAAAAGDTRPMVHMDAMAFGMGCCCLQLTFQARDLAESRYIYDQFAVLSPIMLAATAATPILRGRLLDSDARWRTISESVDDRTPAERGEITEQAEIDAARDDGMAGEGVRRIHKSRYDSVSQFIYHCPKLPLEGLSLRKMNDIDCPVEEDYVQQMLESGVDNNLARHIGHLFIRDPLVIFPDAEQINDDESTEHFENIQSTNWQTVRWKPPPPEAEQVHGRIGWRTEFRPMEVQLTDFENAAFTVFVVLLTRAILLFDLNLYVPLSKVDENMRRAHIRDAVLTQRFFFRTNLVPPHNEHEHHDDEAAAADGDTNAEASAEGADAGANAGASVDTEAETETETMAVGVESKTSEDKGSDRPSSAGTASASTADTNDNTTTWIRTAADDLPPAGWLLNVCRCEDILDHDEYQEMTMAEIFCGQEDTTYPGLLTIVEAYLDYIRCDSETLHGVQQYLAFVRKRVTGEIPTTARWMRDFVLSHPEYQHDSHVSQSVAYDLLMKCKRVGEGTEECPELLGPDVHIHESHPEFAYCRPLPGRINRRERQRILGEYFLRHRKPSVAQDPLEADALTERLNAEAAQAATATEAST